MKPRIRRAKGQRLPGAYLLIDNAPWVCSAPGMIPAYGGSYKNAFFLYCFANGLDSYGRKAPGLPLAARSPVEPCHGSGSAEVASYAKLKRFSRHAIMLPVWLLGLACGLIIAAGIYHGISAG